MKDESSDAKAVLRRAAFSARKRAHAAQSGAAEAVRDRALAAHLEKDAAVVAGYRPIRTEIDPTPLMTVLLDAGLRLCVPVIQAAGQPLLFREWAPDTPMQAGAFGAEIPAEGAWLDPDLLLVPLVAFDATGARLGYGGGFYDRTLERLRRLYRVRAVGIAYAAQQVVRVPVDDSDQRLDVIVTEAGIVQPEKEDTA